MGSYNFEKSETEKPQHGRKNQQTHVKPAASRQSALRCYTHSVTA